jgi:acyl-CoA synthetase (NDP forming)
LLMTRNLDRVFNPRSVAVVGDKKANDYMWLKSLSTFTGKLYSVQIDPKELPGIQELGVENYSSLLDIPQPIDYVIIAVPRTIAPKIVHDCIRKDVGGATLFTSGFAEANTEEGRELESVIVKMAREADFNLIGPNCMGVYNPKIGLRNDAQQYCGEGGPVGFIAQSGTMAISFSLVGESNGIKMSKSVSYGNGMVLDSADFLEYLATDEETKIIGIYIEGVKDGRRFFRCLRETTKSKPVLIWKAGEGEGGARAVACHTASLASSPIIWEALIQQCGAIKVDNLDSMIDIVKGLLYIKPPGGARVGLVAMSGGHSVVMSDAFTRAGLEVPLLCDSSYEDFDRFFNPIGGSCRNPLDISWNMPSVEHIVKILNILSRDENIDSVILELLLPNLVLTWEYDSSYFDNLIRALAEFKNTCPKSFLVVLTPWQVEAEAMKARVRLVEKGIPSFPSFERGAKALKKLEEYYKLGRNQG